MNKSEASTNVILEVKDLRTCFFDPAAQRFVRAVDGVDFSIPRGQTLGLIGESGSGKTITARSIIGLVRGDPGVVSGQIVFRDSDGIEHDLLLEENAKLKRDNSNGRVIEVEKNSIEWQKQIDKRMKPMRGKEISMVFQESSAALNPVFTIGQLLTETIRKHDSTIDKNEAKEVAEKWLKKVRINEPGKRLKQYPRDLSGGMRQRVMIALALCSKPSLLICDEPTTGLDATIQGEIIELLEELKNDNDFKGLSMLFITHDLGIIARLADRVAVMYGGKIMELMELGDKSTWNGQIKHPYTDGLLDAARSMKPIDGESFSHGKYETGCRFYDRCNINIREDRCKTEEPPLEEWPHEESSHKHFVRCWRADYETEKNLES